MIIKTMLNELSFEIQNKVKNCSIDIQSYLLLKEGLKPLVRTGIYKSNLEKVKKTANELGILN